MYESQDVIAAYLFYDSLVSIFFRNHAKDITLIQRNLNAVIMTIFKNIIKKLRYKHLELAFGICYIYSLRKEKNLNGSILIRLNMKIQSVVLPVVQ